MFDDVYQQYRALIAKDAILVVDGALRWDDFIDDWRLAAKTHPRCRPGARTVRAPTRAALAARAATGRRTLRQRARTDAAAVLPGPLLRRGAVHRCHRPRAAILLGEQWTVRPSRELHRAARPASSAATESSSYYAPRVEA